MISFDDAMSQIVELLDNFPTMHDEPTCVAYIKSLFVMSPELKAEQLGIAVWGNYLVENCKQQIEQLINQSETSYLQKIEWINIQENTVLAGSVYMNVISSHILHLRDKHRLKFYDHIQSIEDQNQAVIELSKYIINNLQHDDVAFEEIGQKAVLEIGKKILD